MNIKRMLLTGLMLFIDIILILSLFIYIPVLNTKPLIQNIIFFVLMVPLVLLSAKWYFKVNPPTVTKGLILGTVVLLVVLVLGSLVSFNCFGNYCQFFSVWNVVFSFFEILVLFVYAGWEFDSTFTNPDLVGSSDKK
jgi:CDP-diglyceride synthetase